MELISRKSQKTEITVNINLYEKGKSTIDTTIPFLDHMLEAFSKHGLIDLKVSAKGDTHIDQHHLLEDLGLVLGQTIKKSLGDKKGIARAGFFGFPMDESLGLVAIDLSGRPFLVYKAPFKTEVAHFCL